MNFYWALELTRFTNVNDRYVLPQNLYAALDIFDLMKLRRKMSLKLLLSKHIKNLFNKKKLF